MDICLLLKNVSKIIGKNISKNLNGKYSHKLLGHTKQSAADAFTTTLKKFIQKPVEVTRDLFGNKIVDKAGDGILKSKGFHPYSWYQIHPRISYQLKKVL